jgi:dTDP-4-amino-4,6-dideoxygalactose transaminase
VPAVGARINGRSAGTFGKVNAFSMHPLKPLNVWGDGGITVTDDDDAAAWMRLYRNHGMTDRDHIAIWGVNYRLQPVQAIVAGRQLDLMEEIIAARVRNARRLDERLGELGACVRPPHRPPHNREAYQLYIACFDRRDELLAHLNAHGVEAKIHYPVPLHLQKAAAGLGYRRGDFPVCERQAGEIITLPAHQHVTLEQIDYTADVIGRFYGAGAGRLGRAA